MIHPQITNKLNGQFLSLFLKPLEFFSCQQLSPTTLDEITILIFFDMLQNQGEEEIGQ
jgi:hypothetical protein